MPPDRERDLERELQDLGPRLDYPPTPDLASTVRQRLEENGGEPTARRGWPTVLSSRWAAAAAVLVLFIAIPVLSPAARDTLSGLFVAGGGAGGGAAQSGAESGGSGGGASGGAGSEGAGGGEREAQYSDAPVAAEDSAGSQAPLEDTGGDMPASSGAASSGGSGDTADSQTMMMEDTGGDLPASGGPPLTEGALGEGLGLGERITLREAWAKAGKVFLPSGIGEPDAIHAAGPEGVVLVYRARSDLPPFGDTGVGLVLTELPGDVKTAYFPESPRSYAGTETVYVDGTRAYWAQAGGSADPYWSGSPYANVLFWEREGRALRLESNLPRGEAIRTAESTR